MRHGEAGEHRLPGGDIDDHAAVAPAVPPAVVYVGPAHAAHESGFAAAKSKAVEMATIFRRQPGDERRAPQWMKTRVIAHGSEAIEQAAREHDAAPAIDAEVVDVDVAGRMGEDGDVKPVVAFVLHARRQGVLE